MDQNNDFVSVRSFNPSIHHIQLVLSPAKMLGPHENHRPHLVHSSTLLPSEAYAITPAGHILSTRVKRGRRRLEHTKFDDSATQTVSYTLWSASDCQNGAGPSRISTMLPLELNDILVGYSTCNSSARHPNPNLKHSWSADGFVCRSSLCDLTKKGTLRHKSDIPVSGAILSLHRITTPVDDQSLLVGGVDDGGIAVWNLRYVPADPTSTPNSCALKDSFFSSLKLSARWTIFTQPLSKVLLPQDESHLKGCILAVSEDGTIAVIALDEYQLYVVLKRLTICLLNENLAFI